MHAPTSFLTRILFICAVLGSTPLRAAPLRVVTTTSDLAALATAVGGEHVKATSIASGTADAHFVDARPSYMISVRSADLFLEVGLELEIGWAPLVLDGARNAKVKPGSPGFLDLGTVIHRLEVPGGTVDRSQGDVHAEGNPHWWLDPWNLRLAAAALAQRLAQLQPESRAAFESGLAGFNRRLDEATFGAPLVAAVGGDELWRLETNGSLTADLAARPGTPPLGGWKGQLAPHAGRKVLTYHRSWSYLLARFGLVSAGELEPKPGIPPTPAHLVRLIDVVMKEKVAAILVEPFYSDQAAQLVASKTGCAVLRIPLSVGGATESTDLFRHLDFLVGSLATALTEH